MLLERLLIWYFYPRSPCGERPEDYLYYMRLLGISIHALLAESDLKLGYGGTQAEIFLSTLSLRRATPCSSRLRLTVSYFYPRSPCGERPVLFFTSLASMTFLSTLSLRRATKHTEAELRKEYSISIHALLAESDVTFMETMRTIAQFLSTLSLRRATDDKC